MAHYTTEVSNIVSAIATSVADTDRYSMLRGRTPLEMLDSDVVIDHFGKHVGRFPINISDDDLLNNAFRIDILRMFLKRFYNTEIGQENTLDWYRLVNYFFNEEMPRLIRELKALKDPDWLNTNVSHSDNYSKTDTHDDTTGTANQMNATADMPQTRLNFQLDDPDPTKAYNFNFASAVNGDKSNSSSNSIGDSSTNGNTDSTARNASIMSLINELEAIGSGKYLNLWKRAEQEYGLFSGLSR